MFGLSCYVKLKVKEGFGNQINPCRYRGLNSGPPAQKSDILPLDHQVTATPDRDSYLNLPVIGSLVQYESSALDRAATEVALETGVIDSFVHRKLPDEVFPEVSASYSPSVTY
uniref:Uncharacterized protein n=1 Tax=Timema bartmani TaxID=61472 RepID=A0A7R9F6X6_9NEOP|nr:unnamed protein product [Timema bartmani]